MSKRIEIEFSGSFSITPDEVWPDGDAPEVVTLAAVMAVLNDHGKCQLLYDLDFVEELEITARVDGSSEDVTTP